MKWHTICSCGTKDELEKMINDYYYTDTYIIGDEFEQNKYRVINTKTNKELNMVRLYNGRWQYGKYR